MRFTAIEAIKLYEVLNNMVKHVNGPETLLCNWLRDHQEEGFHIYPESFVMEWKRANPLVKE